LEDLDEKLLIGGDFNGHIRRIGDGYETVHGGFGYGEKNNGEVSILDFAVAYELSIVNSYFKKEDHLISFNSGNTKTQIDLFLMRVNSRSLFKDCKMIPSECLTTQHKLFGYGCGD